MNIALREGNDESNLSELAIDLLVQSMHDIEAILRPFDKYP